MSTGLYCANDCPLLAAAPPSFTDDHYDAWDGSDSDDRYEPYACDCGCDDLDAYDDYIEPYDPYADTPWAEPITPSQLSDEIDEAWWSFDVNRAGDDFHRGCDEDYYFDYLRESEYEVADYREWADAKEGYSPRITWRGTPTIWDRIFAVFPLEEREYKTPSKKRREADRNPRNARRDWSRRGHGENRGKAGTEAAFVGHKRNRRKRRDTPYVGRFEAELRVRADRVQTNRTLRAVQAGMIDPWEINLPGKIPALTMGSLYA